MAAHFHKVFGSGAEAWYTLEASYEIVQAMTNKGHINVKRRYLENWTAVNEINLLINLIEFHSLDSRLGRNVIEHVLFVTPNHNSTFAEISIDH